MRGEKVRTVGLSRCFGRFPPRARCYPYAVSPAGSRSRAVAEAKASLVLWGWDSLSPDLDTPTALLGEFAAIWDALSVCAQRSAARGRRRRR